MKTILFLFVVCSILACSGRLGNLTNRQKKTIIKEVEAFFLDYSHAVRLRGVKAEFDFLDHSQEFYWIPPGYTSPISYDSVAAVLHQVAGNVKSIDNHYDTVRIIPLTTHLATYTSKVRSVIMDTAEVVTSLELLETGVVIKRKEGWKLLHGQTIAIGTGSK
jgi:hypothetical protein